MTRVAVFGPVLAGGRSRRMGRDRALHPFAACRSSYDERVDSVLERAS